MIVDVENKYIHFGLIRDTGKTQFWNVINESSGVCLGQIQYYYGWRQYTFVPVEGSEYNNGCLDAISGFLTRLNKEKRIIEYGKFDTSISTVGTGEGSMP